MREHFSKTGRAKKSVVVGYGQSGRVVTAAAIIMISVFAALILDTDPVVKSMGPRWPSESWPTPSWSA